MTSFVDDKFHENINRVSSLTKNPFVGDDVKMSTSGVAALALSIKALADTMAVRETNADKQGDDQ